MNLGADKISSMLIGAAFLIGGAVTIIKGKRLEKRCTEESEGTITNIINKGTRRMPELSPIFDFVTKDGKSISASCSYSYKRADKHSIGETMRLCYNPENPEDFYPSDEHNPIPAGLVIIIFGIAAVLHGFNMLF